jgi:hypothetical protein
MENYINHIKENKEHHMKKLFIDTFGGTTFKHLIEWFKSQKQGGKVKIIDFNLQENFIWGSYFESNGITKKKQLTDGRWGTIKYEPMGWCGKFELISGYYLEINKYHYFLYFYDKEYKENFLYVLWKKLNKNNNLMFKGVDTDMFTSVDKYQDNYNIENKKIPRSSFTKKLHSRHWELRSEDQLRNGIVFKSDEERISFLENIYKELKIFLICGEKEYRPWKVNFYFEGSLTLDEKYFLEKND